MLSSISKLGGCRLRNGKVLAHARFLQVARPLHVTALNKGGRTNYKGFKVNLFEHSSWNFLLFALFTATAVSFAELEEAPKTNAKDNVYTVEEVTKHNTRASVWVFYQDGVYDITKFVANHPGGVDKIMMAAGGDIAPFWNLYRQHFNSAAPMELLQAMRIGSLNPEDVRRLQAAHNPADDKDPYNSDPMLSPVLKYISRKPINAEPPNSFLTDDWVTPVDLWFVRNHHPVVHVPDVSKFDLKVQFESATAAIKTTCNDAKSQEEKNAITALDLSVEDIKTKFTPIEVTATLQCGGNRRLEMSTLEKTNGTFFLFIVSLHGYFNLISL